MDDVARVRIEAASKGDAAAIEALLAQYLPELRRYLARNAAPLVAARESSSDLAQSVCRDVLERLATERFSYRGEAEFRQWLFNAACLKLRARHRFWLAAKRDAGPAAGSIEPDPSAVEGADREPAAPVASPSAAAGLREEVERLRAALERLPANYRQVVVLAYVDGLSHREIAARLAISEANSRVLLSRALARLATLGVET
jgi:RNA polymerase sigma-70 factor (ECF subfamily)